MRTISKDFFVMCQSSKMTLVTRPFPSGKMHFSLPSLTYSFSVVQAEISAFSGKKAAYLLLTFKVGKGAQGKRKKGEAYKSIFTIESQKYKFSNTLTFLYFKL